MNDNRAAVFKSDNAVATRAEAKKERKTESGRLQGRQSENQTERWQLKVDKEQQQNAAVLRAYMQHGGNQKWSMNDN